MYEPNSLLTTPSAGAYLTLIELCNKNKKFDPELLETVLAQARQLSHQIERQKSIYYQQLVDLGVPIPRYQVYNSLAELGKIAHAPCVVKMDAFCNGLQTQLIKSNQDFKELFRNFKVLFNEHTTSTTGVVQEFIKGNEFTVMVLVGKHNWQPIGSAQDYKREFDNNRGRNTYGMGSIAPANVTGETYDIINTIVDVFKKEYNYIGFLSCQFIVDSDNKTWLLECNNRLCDPEFQSVAPGLDSTVFDQIKQAFTGKVIDTVYNKNRNAVTVSLVHQDWPIGTAKPDIVIPDSDFVFCKFPGSNDIHTYYGSFTNSGDKSHKELAQELYDFLYTFDTAPYRYRTDIGF